MRVFMERQSVSRQDDMNAPNRRVIEIISNCRIKNFIEILIESYCPKVNNDRATWVLWDNHKVLAVFDSVSKKCKCFQKDEAFVREIVKEKENPEMYLYYRGEDDINVVIDEYKEELLAF
ncbi:hypothetical protein SAMN04487886_110111 [Clostridium sp. DSM 8431]|uniref:hypothetical protein n=1 Tax=Clostridium sp. DSM 8431 TaxID=1761781 RepID=UPI0008F18B82|nr:hypothetical protein [Clostridium sp. DSM 8431]SFU68440.1 hypothetical protein SAMN04487886_110111 [Clostridium sp. DSM 8431]